MCSYNVLLPQSQTKIRKEVFIMPKFEKYNLSQVKTERFYQLPKYLFEDEYFKKMSAEAKIMYALLKDRFELSLQNEWVDSNNNIYFIFSNKTLCDYLGYGEQKIIKLKKELINYNLLTQERVGLNKPNRLYLLKPNYSLKPSNSKELPNSQFQNCEFGSSGTVKTEVQEQLNSLPNDTDISDTDISDIDISDTDINGMNGPNIDNTNENTNHSFHSNYENDNHLMDEQTHLLKPLPKELQQFIKSRYSLADSISIINKIMQAKKAAGDIRNDNLFFYFENNDELSDAIIEILIAVNREMKKKQESIQAMLGYYYNALVNGLEEFHFSTKAKENIKMY